MKWADALDAVLDALVADEALAAIPGFQVWRTGEHTEPKAPGVGWSTYTDFRAEITHPVEGQLDLFARGMAQLLAMEERVRALVHHDTPRALGGVLMLRQIIDARWHEDPAPGMLHRSLDFRLEPVRD